LTNLEYNPYSGFCVVAERNLKFETGNWITPENSKIPPSFEFQVSSKMLSSRSNDKKIIDKISYYSMPAPRYAGLILSKKTRLSSLLK
jgi:hypothetical protein